MPAATHQQRRAAPHAIQSSPAPSSSGASPRRGSLVVVPVAPVTDAQQQLHDALAGHYGNWQQAQVEKANRFVTEALAAGLESMHEPPRWGQGSVRFLCEDDEPPRPSWHSHEAAVAEIHQMIVDSLAERGITEGYRLEHAERDFAKGYRPFVSFRLCCDEGKSEQRWRARQTERARGHVAEALRVMIDAAQQGNAEVCAKIPNGRYSNFLSKDEPWPTWLGRERAVHEIKSIVRSQLEAQGLGEGFELEAQGTPMSGVWFKVRYSIPRPRHAEQGPARRTASGAGMQRKVSGAHPQGLARRPSGSMQRQPSAARGYSSHS
eukprot:TRINITY_DN2989_c0_g1_i1.p1 TRINITY_DN2989_c0_g1~~TRINITY_DN2989_c0_g1_i1.p1  ORF type:complete len:348 (+),score=97.19 TRINITY_DN2989_c0_g1_i1:83-1045(+)